MNVAPTTLASVLVTCLGLSVGGVSLGGCSSNEPSNPGGKDASVPDSAVTPDTGAPPKDSGTGPVVTEDTGAPDTGTPVVPCDRPDGGLVCDPGSIYCNGGGCDTTANYCCVESATTQSCKASSAACTGNSLHCDQASDCSGGKICCFVAKTLTSGDSTCQTGSCTGGLFAVQICRENSECGAGKKCIVQTCNGTKIQACSLVTGCTAD